MEEFGGVISKRLGALTLIIHHLEGQSLSTNQRVSTVIENLENVSNEISPPAQAKTEDFLTSVRQLAQKLAVPVEFNTTGECPIHPCQWEGMIGNVKRTFFLNQERIT